MKAGPGLPLFFVLFIGQFIGQPALASTEWGLQVTDPAFDVHHHKLGKELYRPYLDKTAWRCTISETEQKRELELRTIRCDYSVDKAGEFTLYASCGKSNPYTETLFELLDEKKALKFKLMVTCQLKSTKPATPSS